MRSSNSVVFNRTIILQLKTILPDCLPSAGLCVFCMGVYGPGCSLVIAFESRNPYVTNCSRGWCSLNNKQKICAQSLHKPILTKIYLAIWGHVGTMGFNHRAQSIVVGVILYQCSAGHAVLNRAWNRGMHTAWLMLHTTGPTFWNARFTKLKPYF